MYKIVTLCICFIMFVGLGDITADAVELCKVDLSCPGQAATKKGGNWSDFEVSGGCDGDRHDPRTWTDPATNISFTCGQPGGHGNCIARGGDPICNTAYQHWEGEPAPMMLQIFGTGHTAGDYTIEVLHAWNGGSISGLSVSGASAHTTLQSGSVVNTGSDADLLAAVASHTLVEYSIDTDGQSVRLEWSGTPKINAWILHAEVAPAYAMDPDPCDGATNVLPDANLSWTAGAGADEHDVYLGTSFADVNSGAPEVYMTTQAETTYVPLGLLEFGQTYYWKIDEVNESIPRVEPGKVWDFTVTDGKAANPSPAHGSGNNPVDVNLSWTPGVMATSHDVYFGTDETAVANATPASDEYKGNQTETTYPPGTLLEATIYYWRIDEQSHTTVKGDVWRFSTVGILHLKVDLGLPVWGGSEPVPGTVKEGWWGFVAPRWADMYMHDAVWERGEDGQGGVSPPTDGIDGSGVHVALDISNGNGGFHNYDLCRCNLAGDCPPSGSVVGDPIASGWFHNIDWGGECTGDIHMRINDLPAGKYQLTSYHNHWEPCSQSTRNCLRCYSNMPPMQHVYAMSIPVQGTMPCEYVLGWGTGTGVTSITEAYNIDVTSTTSDSEVATSVIEFETDGSDVLVVYDGGDNTYPDPARPDREGHKAILNAFELQMIGAPPPPCWDYLTQCHGDSDNTGDVKGSDFLDLKDSWYQVYPDADYNPCADFDRNGEVKGSDFLILKNNWYQTVDANCPQGGVWPP